MKAVFMLYPVKEYVDEDRSAPHDSSFRYSAVERFLTKAVWLTKDQFRQRFSLVNYLLDQYRDDGYRVAWVPFVDGVQPDMEQVHGIYSPNVEDLVLDSGLTYHEHHIQGIYLEPDRLMGQVPGLERAVVGGFFSSDCVPRLRQELLGLGVDTSWDSLLTEQFFFRMLSTFEYDMHAYLVRNGHAGPMLIEDDPDEEKSLSLDSRIPATLLKLPVYSMR